MRSESPLDPQALVLDASVWLAALDDTDPWHDDARDVIRTRTVLALDLTLYEVANVAVTAWRAPAHARILLDLVIGAVAMPPVAVTGPMLRAAVQLAQVHGITVYDASYAAVADALGRGLVSCDDRDLIGNGLAISPSAAIRK